MDERRKCLTIENQLAEFSKLEYWIAGLVEAWQLTAKTAFAVDLVINEALVNIISYAFQDNLRHFIDIEIQDNGSHLLVDITDDGQAFNPLVQPPLVVGADLQNAAAGGRGIHLIKAYSDEQHYSFISGSNHLRLKLSK